MTADQRDFEFFRLWLLANEDQASADELAKLNRWIEEDPEVRRAIIELTQHQGWLAWSGLSAPGLALPGAEAADHPVGGRTCREEPVTPAGPMPPSTRSVTTRTSPWIRDWDTLVVAIRAAGRRLVDAHLPLLSLRMAALAGCVYLVAIWTQGKTAPARSADAFSPELSQRVQAQIVSLTPCLWSDSSKQSPSLRREYSEGDTLQLLEGVAQLRVDGPTGAVQLQLEGPVAFVLGSQGITNLRYGRIAIENESIGSSSFVVETSFGRVLVPGGAEIGISTFGNQAEVHTFEGSALLDSPWLVSEFGELTSRTIAKHSALRITQNDSSVYTFTSIDSDRSHFTPQQAGAGKYLAVGPNYVESVKASRPVAYWRFEGDVAGIVPNEMGPGFWGQLSGDYRLIGPGGNRSIEFGVLPNPGMMRVFDSWDEALAGDFTLEFWIKPSHYHHGTMLSFAGPFDHALRKNPLGIAVETMGGWGDGASTNRVRYLLRSPIGYRENSSTYTDHIYSPRNWQHIVALRRGKIFETYLEGDLVQSQEGKTDTPPGLQLVVGKLYTDAVFRPYIGCLDELAIYDRALKPAEVADHHSQMKYGFSPSGPLSGGSF